jgi:hypothetical protein
LTLKTEFEKENTAETRNGASNTTTATKIDQQDFSPPHEHFIKQLVSVIKKPPRVEQEQKLSL